MGVTDSFMRGQQVSLENSDQISNRLMALAQIKAQRQDVNRQQAMGRLSAYTSQAGDIDFWKNATTNDLSGLQNNINLERSRIGLAPIRELTDPRDQKYLEDMFNMQTWAQKKVPWDLVNDYFERTYGHDYLVNHNLQLANSLAAQGVSNDQSEMIPVGTDAGTSRQTNEATPPETAQPTAEIPRVPSNPIEASESFLSGLAGTPDTGSMSASIAALKGGFGGRNVAGNATDGATPGPALDAAAALPQAAATEQEKGTIQAPAAAPSQPQIPYTARSWRDNAAEIYSQYGKRYLSPLDLSYITAHLKDPNAVALLASMDGAGDWLRTVGTVQGTTTDDDWKANPQLAMGKAIQGVIDRQDHMTGQEQAAARMKLLGYIHQWIAKTDDDRDQTAQMTYQMALDSGAATDFPSWLSYVQGIQAQPTNQQVKDWGTQVKNLQNTVRQKYLTGMTDKDTLFERQQIWDIEHRAEGTNKADIPPMPDGWGRYGDMSAYQSNQLGLSKQRLAIRQFQVKDASARGWAGIEQGQTRLQQGAVRIQQAWQTIHANGENADFRTLNQLYRDYQQRYQFAAKIATNSTLNLTEDQRKGYTQMAGDAEHMMGYLQGKLSLYQGGPEPPAVPDASQIPGFNPVPVPGVARTVVPAPGGSLAPAQPPKATVRNYGIPAAGWNTPVVRNALQWLGTKYKWGGSDERGIDCSGLVNKAFGASGVKVARTANDLHNQTHGITLAEAKPGDLVFLHNTGGRSGVTHVGIYAGGGRWIQSSSSHGVIVDDVDGRYNQAHDIEFRTFRPVSGGVASPTPPNPVAARLFRQWKGG